jgi:hypothetical protein
MEPVLSSPRLPLDELTRFTARENTMRLKPTTKTVVPGKRVAPQNRTSQIVAWLLPSPRQVPSSYGSAVWSHWNVTMAG